MNLLEIIQQDYQNFPHDQTYEIYAENVYFQDPLTQFRGLLRYQKMIGFMATWFRDIQLDLHNIFRQEDTIHTQWTLSWTTPLPWQPRISISGRSQLKVNPDNLIVSHIDYWHCSRLDVLKQHLLFRNP